MIRLGISLDIKGQKIIAVCEFALVRENNCVNQLGELLKMYGDVGTTNKALTRSIKCMPLKHRRGMMALFNLLITVTHCKKI